MKLVAFGLPIGDELLDVKAHPPTPKRDADRRPTNNEFLRSRRIAESTPPHMEVPRPWLFQGTCFRLQSQWPMRKFSGLLLKCPREPEAAASRQVTTARRRIYLTRHVTRWMEYLGGEKAFEDSDTHQQHVPPEWRNA